MRPPISWSVEVGTVGLLKAKSASAPLLSRLPAGTRVFLPALPADPPSAIEEALRLLRRENPALIPVPHIAASREPSLASLEERLAAWQRASGDSVREVLVVRGDPRGAHSTSGALVSAQPTASGPFSTSLKLLETGVLQRSGVATVSLCGHPEGVGSLSPSAARSALAAKLCWADASGLSTRVVTQLCFFTGAATSFVDALRADGLTTDVSVGVVGPCGLPLRQRMAERCGVAEPTSPYVTPFMRRLARWQAEREPAAGLQAIHLYPFGGLGPTLKWLRDFAEDEDFSNAMGKLSPIPPVEAELRAAADAAGVETGTRGSE